jgi:hypothetical protein
MNHELEKNLSRLADKLVQASNLLTPKMLEDAEAFKAYTAVCEAQAIVWTIADDAQKDLEKMAEELEAKLVEKGWYSCK